MPLPMPAPTPATATATATAISFGAETPFQPLPGLRLHLHRTAGVPSAESWSLLTPDEQARAGRFHFPTDRDRWVNGRAFVRNVLSGMAGQAAADLRMEVREGGKLHLPDHPWLAFNLSHSGDWIVLATAQGPGVEVGVDIEKIDPEFPALEIADEFFLPQERQWIRDGADPTDRFFQLWTAKEALMKATGEGMFLPPNQILITPPTNHTPSRIDSPPDDLRGSTAPSPAAPPPMPTATATVLPRGHVHHVLRASHLGVTPPPGMALAVVCHQIG